MAEKISTYVLAFDGDKGDLSTVLSGFKKEVSSTFSDLQSQASKLDLFKNATAGVDTAQKAFKDAQAAAKLFADQVAKAKEAGDGVGLVLAESLKAANKEVVATGKELTKQTTTVTKLGAQLKATGVDTKNLATEQRALAIAIKQAATAAELQAAKQKLGFKSLGDTKTEIAGITAAYNTLKNSGTLTTISEQAGAWAKTQLAIRDVKKEAGGLSDVFELVKGPALASAAAIGAAVAAIVVLVGKYNEFNDAVLKGAATTNASRASLDKLAEGARGVAKEFGENAQEAVAGVFDLLRAGVPESNAITALTSAAVAAQAGVAGLNETVHLGTTILQGYGKQASDLPEIYDQITFAAKAGGLSIEELSQSIGGLLPIARAAHIPFDELLAAITTLRKSGLDAGASVQVMQKLLQGLSDPDTVAKLQQAGITVEGLVGTLRQISAKNFDLTALKNIAPDAKSVKAVASLTQNFQQLEGTLDGLRTKSIGAAKAASDIIDETQGDRVRKLSAAFNDLQITLGKFAAGSGGTNALTRLVDVINDLVRGAGSLNIETPKLGIAFSGLLGPAGSSASTFGTVVTVLRELVKAHQETAAAIPQVGAALTTSVTAIGGAVTALQKIIAAQLDAAQRKVSDTQNALGGLATALAADISAIQANQAASLKAIDDTSKAAIAALGTQALSQQALEEQTTAITTKAAADRLQVLKDSSAQVLAVFNTEAAARIASVKAGSAEAAKVERDLATERKALIGSIVDAYQKQVADLTALETGYLAKIKSIDQQRVDFNKDIQNQINGIYAQGQGAYAVYAQKVSEIEQDLALARAANAKGEVDLAESYTKQAIGLISSVGSAVTENGKEIVSVDQARLQQTTLLEQAQQTYNKSLDIAKQSAVDGADATAKNLDAAKTGLAAASASYEELASKMKEGLTTKVDLDITNAEAAVLTLDNALQEVGRLVHVQLDLADAQAQVAVLKDDISAGLTAGAQEASDKIVEILAKVGESAPDLKLKTDAAIAQVTDLSTKITDLSKLTPEVTATAVLDAAQATKDLDKLTQDRTVTVTVKTVGGNGGGDGGDSGGVPAGPPGFNRGGYVGQLRQAMKRYARGGSVFAGRKVPGIGDGDTYGARLQSGSFVVRKAASRYYGDALLGGLARGRVQGFATGGLAGRFFQDPRFRVPTGGIQIGLGGASDNPDRDDIVNILQNVLDQAQGIPRDGLLPNLVDWASTLIDRAGSLTDPDKLAAIREAVDGNVENWKRALAFANAWHVPLTIGPDLWALLFARGGGVPRPGDTDTVPAMLTPGEWVVPKGVVDQVGTGFLHSLNNMGLPKRNVASMLAAPKIRRYADGGLVAGSAADVAAPSNPSHGGGMNNTFNLGGTASDILNAANIKRYVIPELEKHSRRSR